MPNSSRMHLVLTLAMACLLAAAGRGALPGTVSGAEPMFVYVGTYAPEDEPGIYIYRFDPATGALSEIGAVAGIQSPSFQALHPSGRFLYSVSESGDYAGQRAGAICAYAIDSQTGGLTLLNCQSSQGPGPCHVCVDRAGRHVLAANYSGGSVVVLPLRPDGQLEAASSFEQHRGASVNPARQEGPHAHCVNLDPAGRYVLAADLGTDQVMIYQYDADHGQLIPNPALPAATVTAGAGPRHFAFHPHGKWGYLINELNSTVTAFTYDARNGSLTTIHDISTLPADFTGKNSTAEIAVSPDGRFVYGSNRGHHSIAVFTVDPQSGRLTAVAHHSTLGEEPRNFAIDPTGTFLLAANQNSGSVVVFRIDRHSGKLAPTGHQVHLPTPVCVTFRE